MTTSPRRLIFLTSGLLVLAPAWARAQSGAIPDTGYDVHLPPAPTLIALENEMHHLDGLLKVIRPRPEYPGLEREAASIRDAVRALQGQVREHLEGRHEGTVGGTAEVNWLRQRILLLRRDIERLPPARPARPIKRVSTN
jgi:hypothetical protein